jgi:hypothetical protein
MVAHHERANRLIIPAAAIIRDSILHLSPKDTAMQGSATNIVQELIYKACKLITRFRKS